MMSYSCINKGTTIQSSLNLILVNYVVNSHKLHIAILFFMSGKIIRIWHVSSSSQNYLSLTLEVEINCNCFINKELVEIRRAEIMEQHKLYLFIFLLEIFRRGCGYTRLILLLKVMICSIFTAFVTAFENFIFHRRLLHKYDKGLYQRQEQHVFVFYSQFSHFVRSFR